MLIRPEFRRGGLGQELVSSAIEHFAHQKQAADIELATQLARNFHDLTCPPDQKQQEARSALHVFQSARCL